MKKSYILLLFLLSNTLICCVPLLNKEVVRNNNFYYGRIRIYKVYDERKIKLMSKNCHFTKEIGIIDSGLKDATREYNMEFNSNYIGKGLIDTPQEKIDYILDRGLLVLKKDANSELIFNKIRCKENDSSTTGQEFSIINLPGLVLEKNKEGINYFGDIDIFLSKSPSDSEKLNVTVSSRYSSYSYYRTINYYEPIQITISNNKKSTLDYLNQTFGTNFLDNQVFDNPMKIMDSKNNIKNSIPKSTNELPF